MTPRILLAAFLAIFFLSFTAKAEHGGATDKGHGTTAELKFDKFKGDNMYEKLKNIFDDKDSVKVPKDTTFSDSTWIGECYESTAPETKKGAVIFIDNLDSDIKKASLSLTVGKEKAIKDLFDVDAMNVKARVAQARFSGTFSETKENAFHFTRAGAPAIDYQFKLIVRNGTFHGLVMHGTKNTGGKAFEYSCHFTQSKAAPKR